MLMLDVTGPGFIPVPSCQQCLSKCGHIFPHQWMFGVLSYAQGVGCCQGPDNFYSHDVSSQISEARHWQLQSKKLSMTLSIDIFFRLTGIYAFIVFFHVSVYRHVNFGPTHYPDIEVGICRKAPWRNLLYINNLFLNSKEEAANYDLVTKHWHC